MATGETLVARVDTWHVWEKRVCSGAAGDGHLLALNSTTSDSLSSANSAAARGPRTAARGAYFQEWLTGSPARPLRRQ